MAGLSTANDNNPWNTKNGSKDRNEIARQASAYSKANGGAQVNIYQTSGGTWHFMPTFQDQGKTVTSEQYYQKYPQNQDITKENTAAKGGLQTAQQSGGGGTASQFVSDMIKSVSDSIIALEEKLANLPGITLSQEELDTFLKKATDQVTPYYEAKKAEVEKGIKEGKIRSAEDIAMQLRTVTQETDQLLAGYDIEQAQSTEELANTLAKITTQSEDQMALKKMDWAERLRTGQQNQVKSGILTSGIGKQQIGTILNQSEAEKKSLEDNTALAKTDATTTNKYTLEKIALARLNAEQDRIRKVGTPEQKAATEAAIKKELGLGPNDALPSDAEIARLRAERNVNPIVGTSALQDVEEQKKLATESRALELRKAEEAARLEEQKKSASLIQSQIATKQREFSSLMSGKGYF